MHPHPPFLALWREPPLTQRLGPKLRAFVRVRDNLGMNAQFLLKAVITVALVLAASFLARRTGWVGALVASLPLTSLLVLGWLYADTRDSAQVADLAMDILWFVLGSLPFFPVLAIGLRHQWPVPLAFLAAGIAGFAGVSLVQWLITKGHP
jgi:hypothetical protein